MHRRQYLPGSQNKTSPATLARYNSALKDVVIKIREDNAAKAQAAIARENSGIRGFLKRARRVLTTPIRVGKRGQR